MPAQQVIDSIASIVEGKPKQIKLAVACILANGHLLIEDLPGMGKTTLAHAMAAVTGLDYSRIQFTSDLLPADILGAAIFRRDTQSFEFHKGPIFSNIVLADEINRATPKAQSALLEAMEERQVSIEGETYPLPAPFFVIATQNPLEQAGTFLLPESQLDRFLMRLTLGYPPKNIEKAIYMGQDKREQIRSIKALLDSEQLLALQAQVNKVIASSVLVDYVLELVGYSRQLSSQVTGLSPRGGMAIIRAAKAWAFIEGRDFVVPEDVQAVLRPVAEHRLSTPGISSTQLNNWFKELLALPVPK